MPNPQVSFVLATYNRGSIVVDCLRRVLDCGLPQSQFEILVVDNASTDATADLIRRFLPQVTLIRLAKNCGPVAKNVAIKKSRGQFVVLLDDDAYPHPGAVPQMLRHFHDDPKLAAAVFDVTLPDGTREASAYPDVFIGAGAGLRRSVLNQVGLLPSDFFMQAEEYDLSFRIIQAGFSVQRFWDLPLTHLKSPAARIGQRTTRLDVRNNLYLLAKYLPEPLCHELAADWLARYFMMAVERDRQQPAHSSFGTHKQAFVLGAAQGLERWPQRRDGEKHLLSNDTIERIFKFEKICERMGRALYRSGTGEGGGAGSRRVIFADFGKNMLAYYRAARSLKAHVLAIVDDNLAGPVGTKRDYRGVPITCANAALWHEADLVIVSNMSPVHGPRRAAELKRTLQVPVTDLFSPNDPLIHRGAEFATGRL